MFDTSLLKVGRLVNRRKEINWKQWKIILGQVKDNK